MSDEAVSLRDINWRETFPFTHLFRAFRVAVHPSKLILALLALGFLWCGGLLLDAMWNRNYQVRPAEIIALVVPETGALNRHIDRDALHTDLMLSPDAVDTERMGIFRTFFAYEVSRANQVLMFTGGTYQAFESIWQFVVVGPLWLWTDHWFFALIYTAWFLLIWSVFGGAISRIAAVHVGRDEKTSVRSALSFSVSKVLSFIFAPVIPVLIVLGIGVVIAVAATILLHIPYVGPILAGLFFCFALLGGFVVTLVILGTIGGFNLMYPTVAVEGSDSFDAISRSFSYVFARPWRMLWYTGVAIVYGAICYLFVRFFVWLMLAVTWFFMSWFLGRHGVNQPAAVFPVMWPPPTDPLGSLPYSPDYEHLKSTEAAAAGLIVWWNYIVIGLIGAFAISFYFSANTIIYYLMRREVDATEMDDVYVEETEDAIDEPAAMPADSPAGTPATVIKEASTVRVYETEEGAPAPAESSPPPSTGPAPESATPTVPPPPAPGI